MKNNHLLDDKEILICHDEQFENVVSNQEYVPHERTDNVVKKATKKVSKVIYYILAIAGALTLIGTLIYAVMFLQAYGSDVNNPMLNDIFVEYIENGIQKTGATNFVTGMILDYRAFDTLGESFVLFTAVNIVLILLQGFKDKKEEKEETYKPLNDPILRTGCSVIVPFIFLFGIYVILNGSISPGGGFSGGSIMGAGLILYSIAFGFENSGRFFKDKTFKAVSSFALLTYCASKTYSFLTGALEVHSIVPLGVPGAILSGGIIFILNVAVGMVVTCTMFGFYSLFKKGEI